MVTDKRISDSLPTLPGDTWHADPPQHDALLQRWVGANARVAHTLVSGSQVVFLVCLHARHAQPCTPIL